MAKGPLPRPVREIRAQGPVRRRCASLHTPDTSTRVEDECVVYPGCRRGRLLPGYCAGTGTVRVVYLASLQQEQEESSPPCSRNRRSHRLVVSQEQK